MIRVLIADDHTLIRRGLVDILHEVPDIMVAAEAATGRQTLQRLRENKIDVLVLDITMPEGGGLDILPDIMALNRALPVLILSVYPEEQFARHALKAGAMGYLNKDSAPEELIQAIRSVASGQHYLSPLLAEILWQDLLTPGDEPLHETLSVREFQVLLLLAAGVSLTEIAADMALHVSTVSTYRGRVLEKLNLSSNAELIRYALTHKLID